MAIRNPVLPYIGPIGGSLVPGRSVRITGTVHPGATRFGINLQCGPGLYPRDDVAIHISPDFMRNCIVRNTISGMNWGPEETTGHFPLSHGQPFDITILCERDCYKVTINGHHYTDFIHRVPFERVTHFSVDGDITVNSIEYFGGGYSGTHMPMPVPMSYPVPHGVHGHIPSPHMPHLPPPGPHGYYPPPHNYAGAHAPYPTQPGVPYPTQPGVPYPTQPGAHYPTQPGMPYPTQPGVPHSPYTEPYKKPSVLGKAGALIAGTAIGSTVLGNKKGLKAQKKAHKKALKYGLPIAGAGLGAYALHKTFHHHGHHGHSSSSSSSSSSSEEE